LEFSSVQPTAAIVLTGGMSSRMGSPKALLTLGDQTFLDVILSRLKACRLDRILVVHHQGLQLEAVDGVQYVVNTTPELGQLSSLQCALHECLDCHWVLMALVDCPNVSLETYQALVEAAKEKKGHMWVPSHAGRRGHPVIFGVDCFHDLLTAPLNEGARWAVARHREHRVEIPVTDPEIHRDVDTPEDYQKLLRQFEV
jgi:molybdenum cofactor cytidylyltransferase